MTYSEIINSLPADAILTDDNGTDTLVCDMPAAEPDTDDNRDNLLLDGDAVYEMVDGFRAGRIWTIKQ